MKGEKTIEDLKAQIREAFADVEYPSDWCLRGSNEGDEPFVLEEEFKGKTDWRTLNAEFIDNAPDGFGSALSFFSDEAFHFYLPAYLIADVDDLLSRSNPTFALTHGLDLDSGRKRINPKRYGERTWLDHARCKFAMFHSREVAAITAYLRFKMDSADTSQFERKQIEEALENYWVPRSAELECR